MSNARRRRHRRQSTPRLDPDSLTAMAAVSSSIRGCTCAPSIHREHRAGIVHLTILHDDHCPAIDHEVDS